MLYCIQPAGDGGESVLVDGFRLAEELRKTDPGAFELLATQPQVFHRVVPEDGVYQITRARVLSLDESGNIVGFRFHTRNITLFELPEDKVGTGACSQFGLEQPDAGRGLPCLLPTAIRGHGAVRQPPGHAFPAGVFRSPASSPDL